MIVRRTLENICLCQLKFLYHPRLSKRKKKTKATGSPGITLGVARQAGGGLGTSGQQIGTTYLDRAPSVHAES